MKLFVDGAARGNPGPAGIGVVLKEEDGTVLLEVSEYIGETTNNVAEYSALLRGLEEAGKLAPDTLTVYTDSELMARQLSGQYKVKAEHLQQLHREAQNGLRSFRQAEVCHILREFNASADRLASKAARNGKKNKKPSPCEDGADDRI